VAPVDEPVVEVSRVIRPFLRELVGQAYADELDRRIASILNGWSSENTTIELRAALESHEATRYFMEEVLEDAPDFRPPQFQPLILRGYQPLPGEQQPTHTGKFACPQSDYIWYRPSVGTPIPVCPTHGVTLARVP
jgi:hypothetical protein